MIHIFKRGVIEKLIPDKKDEAIYKKIDGKFFVFDKESEKEFNNFNKDLFRIVIINGYLARQLKCKESKVTFFHEWLMREGVEKFKELNNYFGRVEIHHTTFCKRINIKKYLKIYTKEQHRNLHRGYFGIKWLYDE